MELPFVWVFHKGGAAPSGDRWTAATAGTGRPFPKSRWRPLRCDGSKHAAAPRFQSTMRLTSALVPQRHRLVQERARVGGDFFTRWAASAHTSPCGPGSESDTPRQWSAGAAGVWRTSVRGAFLGQPMCRFPEGRIRPTVRDGSSPTGRRPCQPRSAQEVRRPRSPTGWQPLRSRHPHRTAPPREGVGCGTVVIGPQVP